MAGHPQQLKAPGTVGKCNEEIGGVSDCHPCPCDGKSVIVPQAGGLNRDDIERSSCLGRQRARETNSEERQVNAQAWPPDSGTCVRASDLTILSSHDKARMFN
jgi:hypothetical protein